MRRMIYRPAHDLQIAFVGLLDHRRRHQVTAHHNLPRAHIQRGFQWICELPVIQNTGHQRRLDLAQARQNRRVKRNHHHARHFSRLPQRADQRMLAAPGAAGFQLQIKYDVVFFRELQNFFESRDALSGIFAAEPRAGVETAQHRKRLIVHLALAVGGAVHGVIMDGHKPRVAGELQIRLDKSSAQSDRLLERGERIFRRVPEAPRCPMINTSMRSF